MFKCSDKQLSAKLLFLYLLDVLRSQQKYTLAPCKLPEVRVRVIELEATQRH